MCVFGYLTAEARAVCLPAQLALSWLGTLGFRVLGVSLHPSTRTHFQLFWGNQLVFGLGFHKGQLEKPQH